MQDDAKWSKGVLEIGGINLIKNLFLLNKWLNLINCMKILKQR
jgi:hypothetical protein